MPQSEYRQLYATPSGWELRYLDGTVTHFDGAGRWWKNVDRNSNTLEGTYDASGRLETVSFPDGRTEGFTYHPSGKLATITENPNPADEVERGAAVLPRTWSYTWSGDDLERIDRPDGTAWRFVYDAPLAGYMTAKILVGSDGGERIDASWEYDGEGNVRYTWRGSILRTDPEATELWELEYDSPVHPTETTVIDPYGQMTVYTMERLKAGRARLASIQGTCPGCGFGGNTTFLYEDPAHPYRVTTIIDGEGNRDDATWDALGQRDSLTEAVGDPELLRTTAWMYDPDFPAFVERIEQPGVFSGIARVTVLQHDSNGNLETETIEGYEETFEGGPTFSLVTSFEHHPLSGELTSIDRPGYGTDDVTTFTYSPKFNHLVAETRSDPLIGTTHFEHDGFGRRTATIDPNGTRTETTYDPLNRVTSVRVCNVDHPADPCLDSGVLTIHEYTEFGDLDYTSLPRGNVIDYEYDTLARLVTVARRPDLDSNGEQTIYTLDEAGNRELESLERWDGSSWVTDAKTETIYESRCQVKRTVQGKDSPNESVTEFDYDCNGNLTHEWDANHPATGPPSRIYLYDALERLKEVREPWGGEGGGGPCTESDVSGCVVTIYAYDAQDHLIRITDGEGGVTEYDYSDRDLQTEERSEVSGTTEHRQTGAARALDCAGLPSPGVPGGRIGLPCDQCEVVPEPAPPVPPSIEFTGPTPFR